MPFEQFLDLTPLEFYEALREKEKRDEDVTLSIVKVICETLRLQTLHLSNIHLPRGRKITNLKKLMVFKWEREPQPAQTQEQMKGIMKAIAKSFANKKKKDNGKRNRNIRR